MEATMSRFISLLLALCLTNLPFLAHSEEVESNGQILLIVGRNFAPFQVSEGIRGAVYAHIGAMASVRGNAMVFGYVGPEFTFTSQTNLKMLTGTWLTKDGGMSAIASLWLTQPLPGDVTVFLEGDAYFPIDGDGGHRQRNYYTFVSLDWFPKGNVVGLGVVQENFFSEKVFEEAAIGPALLFDKGRIWLAYDTRTCRVADLPASRAHL